MFQGLIKRAENTIDQVVSRFVGRAMVAVPLLVAAGFATAAISVKLVELYGAVTAYVIMAAAFSLVALVTMAIVGVEQREAAAPAEEPPQTAAETDQPSMDPADLLTPEVRAFLSSAAPMALPVVARGIGRNLPLVFILALIGFVISRFADASEAGPSTGEGDESGGEAVAEREAAA